MLFELRKSVLEANLLLVKYNLAIFTWGNVSGIDRSTGLVAIKPSGVDYDSLKIDDIPIVDLEGNRIFGNLNPSSDTPTHLMLYKHFTGIGGVVHSHSSWATSWAQAGKSIPAYGTTHADYFLDKIPCTRQLSPDEVSGNYEENTGKIIVECFRGIEPDSVPAVLVKGHGPFSWGKNPLDAVHNAVVLEEIARMAFYTEMLGNKVPLEKFLLEKHFFRKHGSNAYYGQRKRRTQSN